MKRKFYHKKTLAIPFSLIFFGILSILFVYFRSANVSELKIFRSVHVILKHKENNNNIAPYFSEQDRLNDAIIYSSTINSHEKLEKLNTLVSKITIFPFEKKSQQEIPSDTSVIKGLQNFHELSFSLGNIVSEKSDIDISFEKDENRLNLYLKEMLFSINNEIYRTSEKPLSSFENIEDGKVAKIGGLLFQINRETDLSVPYEEIRSENVKIYSESHENLLDAKIASFDGTTWMNTPNDCSINLPGTASFALEKTRGQDGSDAVKISSENHHACIYHAFSFHFSLESVYLFSFDGKNIEGEKLQYYLRFYNKKDPTKTLASYSKNIQKDYSHFERFSYLFDQDELQKLMIEEERKIPKDEKNISFDPENIDMIEIYFYAPSDGSKKISNIYDNVQLHEFQFDAKLTASFENLPKKYNLIDGIHLSNDKNTLTHIYTPTNLLKNNSSFELGPWEEEAKDCSYMSEGEKNIGLQLYFRDDKNPALKIWSKNHNACTSKKFPVHLDPKHLYLLSFDYRNIQGDIISYYYNLFGGKYSKNSAQSFDTLDHSWHTKTSCIPIDSSDIDTIEVFFYAPSDGKKEVVNVYDNLSLTEYILKESENIYLAADIPEKIQEDQKIIKLIREKRFEYTSPSVDSDPPLFISFPKKYSRFIKLSINKIPISEDYHYQVNNYENGWIIDQDTLDNIHLQDEKELTFTISHTVEKIFILSNIILIFFGTILLLLPFKYRKIFHL